MTYIEEAQSDDVNNIKSALSSARTIVILGFGYHKQNIDLMRLPGGPAPRRIFMTTHGIAEENDQDFAEAVRVCLQSDFGPRNYNQKARTFMVRLRPSLVIATS